MQGLLLHVTLLVSETEGDAGTQLLELSHHCPPLEWAAWSWTQKWGHVTWGHVTRGVAILNGLPGIMLNTPPQPAPMASVSAPCVSTGTDFGGAVRRGGIGQGGGGKKQLRVQVGDVC